MFDEPETKKLKKQLHFLKGQLEGIENMINDNRDFNEVFIQSKAVEGGVQKLIYDLLDNLLRKELAEKVVKVVNVCPGNCPDAEKIKVIHKEFPNMELKKVASIINEMEAIEKRLNKFNENKRSEENVE